MNNTEKTIERLKSIRNDSLQALKVSSYDINDEASIKKLRKYIDDCFKSKIKLRREINGSKTEIIDEYSYNYLLRRKTALLNYSVAAEYRMKQKYPGLSVAQEYVNINSPMDSLSFNKLNDSYYIELAAAIWILDYLKDNGKLDEALQYFPETRDRLDSVFLPLVTDSVHPDDLIKGMLYIIHYRNLGIKGFDDKITFMDDADTGLNPPESTEESAERKCFESIMHLIDTDIICEIRDSFTKNVWQITDILILRVNKLQSRIKALTDKKIEIINNLTEKYSETDNRFNETTVSVSSPQIISEIRESEMTTMIGEAEEQLCELDDEIRRFELIKSSVCRYALSQYNSAEVDGSNKKIIIPKIGDPFAMCFGFLNLLDTDSDIVWVYNIPYAIMSKVCSELPWADCPADSTELENGSEINPDFAEALSKGADNRFKEITDSFLDRKVFIPPFGKAGDPEISFSKLVFLLSGLVVPRSNTDYRYIKALIKDDGLTAAEAELLCDYLALACSVSKRNDYVFIDDEDNDNTEVSEEQNDSADVEAEKIRILKRENKSLKSLVNKLEHRIKETDNALRSTDEKLEAAVSELAELRSMIRKAESTGEEFKTTVSFPYSSIKRAVVFGGHESWSKSIRNLLNNVRFVDASAIPNTSLIMNADVVWIQTNAISHSSFYKIIDVIRKHDIELRYFKYSSAEKCAEQFALEDMKMCEEESA